MNNRRNIVEHTLKKYLVDPHIEEILDQLSFKELSSLLPDWKLFTRRSENNEFAAIYRDKEYLIQGSYSRIDVPQRDLENITKYIFNEKWISRKIRGKNMAPLMIIPVAGMGICFYDILNILKGNNSIFRTLDDFVNSVHLSKYMNGAGLFIYAFLGGMIASSTALISARALLNKYYASKLSKEAENYDYGFGAESKLEEELIFKKIKSGELSEQDFLELERDELKAKYFKKNS